MQSPQLMTNSLTPSPRARILPTTTRQPINASAVMYRPLLEYRAILLRPGRGAQTIVTDSLAEFRLLVR